jgi:hypothetical protein
MHRSRGKGFQRGEGFRRRRRDSDAPDRMKNKASQILVTMIQEHGGECSKRNPECPPLTPCGLCDSMNRDTLVAMSRMEGARLTIDLGIALCAGSRRAPYEPYAEAGFTLYQQGELSEEKRLHDVFNRAFRDGYRTAVVIGHGVPNLPQDYVSKAFFHLQNGSSFVIGPLSNGSFYLLGMRRKTFQDAPAELFSHLQSRRDLATYIRKGFFRRKNCAVLPEWYRINSIGDLNKLYTDCQEGRGYRAPWTRHVSLRVRGAL